MTAQVSETLIYQDQKLSMCAEPLGFWLATAGKHIELRMFSTACWRGYVGKWKIVNDRLYLTNFQGNSPEGKRLRLDDLFPGYSNGVFAHWFTGEVRCPYGKMLDYVHMGYASTYEKDLYFQFSKGVLVSTRTVINGIGEKGDPEGYGVAAFTTFPVGNRD